MTNLLQTFREDDFVEYYLFPSLQSTDEKEQEALLETVLSKANRVIEKYTQDYLWHKDPIQFVSRTSLSNFLIHNEGRQENQPPHLYGVSHYGDNIEDEWFIVFLLQEITKEIPGVIARVYDSDGEFLLIEAADYLPGWASPETCENRVFIYEGNIHLLPLTDPENPNISIEDAVEQIWTNPQQTIAHQDIQNSIRNRLSQYPDNIKDNFHYATIYVPTAVAAILKVKPNLISWAVQAFCNRDTVDMKACRAMKYFPPEQRVKTRVKFTKCLYAMLLRSKYLPDKKIGWNLPPAASKEYKQHILGIKVACGFEILAVQAKPSQDIEGDRGWAQYLKSLMEKGYFQGLLEGSRDYNYRLGKAKEYYVEHRDSMHYSSAIGQQILELLRSSEVDHDLLEKESQHLPPDDDDSWLDISVDDLDKMLQERYGQKKMFKVTESTDPSNFAQKVNTFLNHISDVEGAEFPPDEGVSPVKPPRSKKSSKKGVSFSQDTRNDDSNKNKVNFDPNSFASAIQNILNFVIPEDDSWDLESDSDMSEYENDEFVKDEDMGEEAKGVKNKMQEYMKQMDAELAGTTIGKSFEKKAKNGDNSFDDIEDFEPVDIDVNALKNMLASYQSQMGEAGPSSTMLGPMGIHLDSKK
ncbi:protein ecdysoneless [Anthonomus grandis grandis]|uniref:protein ecdysoneless n=1 Tax=Anthonomus grandis grandis TaxID=2921223 RepID=UPI002165BF71|nr:protein ecdysoneless [Anthonomus grandis grandis]